MENLATYIYENYLFGLSQPIVNLLVMFVFAGIVLMLFVAPFAGITSFVERRIAARTQDRIGPNRVGPQGILQFLADGVKSLLKEDLIPRRRIAPYLSWPLIWSF